MSRHRLEREEQRLDDAYERGELTLEEYRSECRQLQQDAKDEYEADLEAAAQRVKDDWGW